MKDKCAAIILVAFTLVMAVSSCDQPKAAVPNPEWTYMGSVNDSTGGATVYKRKDPDNGKTVYVAIGVNACSITVADTK